MIAYVDTNILIRLMTNDVLELSHQAQQLVTSYNSAELIILDAALVELFFVLETRPEYNFSHQVIAGLFRDIIVPTRQFRLAHTTLQALEMYAHHPKLDFMDCLLATHANSRAGGVLTFDKDLQKILA